MAAIRILNLEDSEADAMLIESALRKDGLEPKFVRVWTRESYEQALSGKHEFDLIVSDNRLPAYDGQAALAFARAVAPDLPFVFVSGSMGEEAAVESLKNGAVDYILKDRLGRLPSAIRRAINEANERRLRRQAEASLQRAQKMEAIGLLAGGIAHDFNNLLTVINGRSMLMMSKLPEFSEMRREFEMIYKTGERAAALTRQLLAFSSKQVLQNRPLNLNIVVTDLHRMLKRLIRENIHLEMSLSPEMPNILADPAQIEQVIMNLVVNARDALPDGGTVYIETRRYEQPENGGLGDVGMPAGTYAALTVRDTGVGMDEATLARIFEPFFTTKAANCGTGLGLSTVYGIVNQLRGNIRVWSQPGRGAEFNLVFPVTDHAAEVAVREHPALDAAGGSETILVVEDDEGIRGMVGEILESEGYRVLLAENGRRALELAARTRAPIDLLISDVMMPEMGGIDLLRAIRPARPEIRALLVSGYAPENSGLQEAVAKTEAFLKKPFTPASLLQAVRKALAPCPNAPPRHAPNTAGRPAN
ncbi:MAG: response regulator [Planctomycetota bacterium]|nr:response regulator [Planctomycetota bacterium]